MSLIRRNANQFPLFNNFFNNQDLLSYTNKEFHTPSVNIIETETGFKVELAAPGLKKEDFKIDLDQQVLTITAEKKTENEEKKEKYTRKEFGYSSFKRSFTLGNTIDGEKIEASYQDGILLINLPKKEEAKKKPARTVEIA